MIQLYEMYISLQYMKFSHRPWNGATAVNINIQVKIYVCGLSQIYSLCQYTVYYFLGIAERICISFLLWFQQTLKPKRLKIYINIAGYPLYEFGLRYTVMRLKNLRLGGITLYKRYLPFFNIFLVRLVFRYKAVSSIVEISQVYMDSLHIASTYKNARGMAVKIYTKHI